MLAGKFMSKIPKVFQFLCSPAKERSLRIFHLKAGVSPAPPTFFSEKAGSSFSPKVRGER